METQNTINQRVKDARKALGYTQDQLSELTGIKRSSISKIESGKMEVPTDLLMFLTGTNNISSEWLLEGRYPVFKSDETLLSDEEKQLNQRVIEVFEVFGWINQTSGEAAFCKAIGISKADFGRIIRNELAMPAYALVKLAKLHNLSLDWLQTGIGSINEHKTNLAIIDPAKQKSRMPTVVTVDNEGNENVPLVHVKARAGYLLGYADPEYIETLPAYRLPNVNHGTYRMWEVEGHSMAPTLDPGDIVITEWVEHPDRMRDDRIYVLVTHDEGILIKRCINRLKNPGMGFILAKSDNTLKQSNKEQYPPIVVRPEQIKEIWYARFFLSSQFTAPSDLYNRLNNLEAEMELFKQAVKQLNKNNPTPER